MDYRILHDIVNKFKEYESRLDLLRWIDQAIANESILIDKFFSDISQRLIDVFHLRNVYVYTFDNGSWLPVTNRSSGFKEIPIDILELIKGTQYLVIKQPKNNTVLFYAALRPKKAPPILVVISDDHISEGNLDVPISILHEQEFQSFFLTMAAQIEIFINNKIRQKLLAQKETVSKAFFATIINDKAGYDGCWGEIAKLFAGFIPEWNPFKIEPPPLVQILTYRSKMPNVIELQASHLSGDDPLSNEVGKLLRKETTICGLYIEREEAGVDTKGYIYVNPTDPRYNHRYTSILFENPPNSELHM